MLLLGEVLEWFGIHPLLQAVGHPEGWSDKRERQYEHIKDSYQERGVSKDEAEERAARTVNKERSEKGETKDGDD